jgi:hypothetical protein
MLPIRSIVHGAHDRVPVRFSAAALADEVSAGTLAARLTEQYRHAYGYSPGPSEVRNWERSIPAFVGELRAAGLDDVDVLIEYRLPLTMTYAREQLRGRLACEVSRRYLRWLHPTSRRRPDDSFL